jgi:hypothetical protein
MNEIERWSVRALAQSLSQSQSRLRGRPPVKELIKKIELFVSDVLIWIVFVEDVSVVFLLFSRRVTTWLLKGGNSNAASGSLPPPIPRHTI